MPGESPKNVISWSLFTSGWLVLGCIAVFVGAFFVLPYSANAGLLSNIFRFLTGGEEKIVNDTSAAYISFPLLGSQVPNLVPPGVGGPVEGQDSSLPVIQDGALVATRNPLGILAGSGQDQILIYTVQEGDNPSSIAANFGISLNTLLWANNIRNPNLIKAGDELVILPISGVKYEIKAGDTLESIAKKFRADPGEIMSFNGLAIGEVLVVASVIIIPDGEIALPATAEPQRTSVAGLPEFRGYYMRPIIGGRRSRGIHGYNGVDLASSCGLPVLASAEGTVILVRSSGWNGGYGKYLVITHPNGTQTLYAHVSSILARVGQSLAQGSQVAMIGSTGNSTGCHLHFEVRGAKNPF